MTEIPLTNLKKEEKETTEVFQTKRETSANCHWNDNSNATVAITPTKQTLPPLA